MLEVQFTIALKIVEKFKCRIAVADFDKVFTGPTVRDTTVIIDGKTYRIKERVLDEDHDEDGLDTTVVVGFLSESIQRVLYRYPKVEAKAAYLGLIRKYWGVRTPTIAFGDRMAYIRRREVFCRDDSDQQHDYEFCEGRMVFVCDECGYNVASLA